MRMEHEKSRRQAENRISEVNRYLDSNRIKDPKKHAMLEDMREKAYNTLKHINDMERNDDDRSPYKNTNIGYGADARQRRTHNDTRRMLDDAMDAINKILPNIVDDLDDDDVEMRRGVPGTGPYSNPRLRRRGGRKGIGRRRADLDDMDDRYDTDDRYDMDDMDDMDDRYDDIEARRGGRRRRDSRGRFVRSDYDRYDDMRYDDRYSRTDDDRRITSAVTRAAADAAADTARRMANDRRTSDDIYPHIPPIMPHQDRTNDARYDRRDDMRTDRTDDRTADDAARPVGVRTR